MITANSHREHRVDTSLHGGMTNLNDSAPAPLGRLTERDFAPKRRPLLVRIWRACARAVLLPIYRRQLACLLAEREGYVAARVPLGPAYLANCAFQERVLRGRIAFVECDL